MRFKKLSFEQIFPQMEKNKIGIFLFVNLGFFELQSALDLSQI